MAREVRELPGGGAGAAPSAAEEGLRREDRAVTETILARVGVSGAGYVAALALSTALLVGGLVAWGFQLRLGLGLTGLQHPMMWAVYITSFVWWIGIAHSGTLLSAILFLLRAPFRAAFARAAEAMTLFAIGIAALYPIIHLGRPWRAYWLFPYPNQRDLWITFRSPLVLDVFAIATYFAVSLLFFWLGLLPDLALLRDRSRGWARTLYGVFSVGWEGRAREWGPYRALYGLLAALATPLVVSVHTIVSWDFALAIVPGWHSTLFPPYFVVGAIFSGLGMVLTLMIPLRRLLRLESFVTVEHLERLARLVLAMSLLLSFAYLLEAFMVWFGQDAVERENFRFRTTGAFAPHFWTMLACNSAAPLVLLSGRARRSPALLFGLSLLIGVGMWLERFVIVAGSLARDYLPYAWAPGSYRIMPVEVGIFAGTVGAFFLCFLLFIRYLPVLPIAELRHERRRAAKHPEEAPA